jgi:hypothetical protein
MVLAGRDVPKNAGYITFIRSVNYLILLDRFLKHVTERGRMGRPSGECRMKSRAILLAVLGFGLMAAVPTPERLRRLR